MLGAIFSWAVLYWLLILLYVFACALLIVVVLMQKGKGVGFAGAFGAGGGTDAVFGPRSSRSLPQRLTYTLAGIFMFLALVISTITGKVGLGAAPELLQEDTIEASSVGLDELFDEAPSVVPPDEVPPPDQPLELDPLHPDPADVPPVPAGDTPIQIEDPLQDAAEPAPLEVVPAETVPEPGDAPDTESDEAQQ